MKARHFVLLIAFSALSFKFLSPNQSIKNRMPASENEAEKVEVTCKAEQQGEKLESEIKQLILDKESILKEVDALKKERSQIKKPHNEEILSLMSEMTSLYTAQMQQQMQMQLQMQNQMMAMFSKIQTTLIPDSQMIAPAHLSFQESLDFSKMFVGIPQHSPWSQYQNPYAMMPELNRSQLPSRPGAEFGFFPQPAFTGFDFSHPMQAPVQSQPAFERQQISFAGPSLLSI